MNSIRQMRWLSPKRFFYEHEISIDTQAQLRMKQKIPYSKIGKFIRYDSKKIDIWWENHEIVGLKTSLDNCKHE